MLFSDAHWTEQMQRKSCVRADLAPLSNDHRDTLRDSLKFVQEVARFVTSRFFGVAMGV